MTTDPYTQFKQAFLDQALLKGYDADFLEGFFKRAEDEYSQWETLVELTYKGDTALCKQAYAELAASLGTYGVSDKMAEASGMGPEILGLLTRLGGSTAGMFGQSGGAGLGGALVGGGGGLLIGLILSQMLGIPLSTGMLLGALGGAGLGYGAAGTPAGQHSIFGSPDAPPPKLPNASQPAPAPNHSAANDVAANQAASNQAVAGVSPKPQAPLPGPGGQPVAPPEQMGPPPAPEKLGPPPAPTPAPAPNAGAPQPLRPGTQSPGIPPIGAPALPTPPKPPGAK